MQWGLSNTFKKKNAEALINGFSYHTNEYYMYIRYELHTKSKNIPKSYNVTSDEFAIIEQYKTRLGICMKIKRV